MSVVHEYRGYVQGPRWVNLKQAVDNAAFDLGLRCESRETKSFFTSTVRYAIWGNVVDIARFKRWVEVNCDR